MFDYRSSTVLSAGFIFLVTAASGVDLATRQFTDPCSVIGGQKWAAPADVRACYKSIPVNETVKANILEVITKSLAFHTSVNYQVLAPFPYSLDVHEDLLGDLKRIGKTSYPSEYDLHIDLSRSVRRLNDGHCVWVNNCFDSLFVNYLPIPLVVLDDADGSQNIHIAPAAFSVASVEFADEIDVWQNALTGELKGKLSSLSGAKVISINGQNPWVAVDANTLIAGSYQAFGTRQNGFFGSYQRVDGGYNYVLGNFAQQALPLADSVTLSIQLVNSTKTQTVTLPYRSRFGAASHAFSDAPSFLANNCKAVAGTNGENIYATSSIIDPSLTPAAKLKEQPPVTGADLKKYPLNVITDTEHLVDVVLPPVLTPTLTPVNGSYSVAQFYLLDSNTGVLALGSFSAASYEQFMSSLLEGLTALKELGATRLVVDLSNNGGGFICVAHFLHRILIGPKATTEPQAGLDTVTRAGPLAQQIVKQIVFNHTDPDNQLLYNPIQWADANNIQFSADTDWLANPTKKIINLRPDAFSQRLGSECSVANGAYTTIPPDVGLFDPKNIVLLNNGRCASSCALFTTTMNKREGVRAVVYGGKRGIPQAYAGTVGGQSTDFSTIDTEIKSSNLKKSPLAPPDLLSNGVQGITWRLGFGIDNPNEPEEWQSRAASAFPLTSATVNNPVELWKAAVAEFLD